MTRRWLLLSVVLLGAAPLLGCWGDGSGGSDESTPIDPSKVGTVELSEIPPDGTAMLINEKYFLAWQAKKIPISSEDTTLEELEQSGVTVDEPAASAQLVVAAPGVSPSRWVLIPRPVAGDEEGEAVEHKELYLVYDNQAHLVPPRFLPGLYEFGLPDEPDQTIVDRVRLPEQAPPPQETATVSQETVAPP